MSHMFMFFVRMLNLMSLSMWRMLLHTMLILMLFFMRLVMLMITMLNMLYILSSLLLETKNIVDNLFVLASEFSQLDALSNCVLFWLFSINNYIEQ